MQSSSSNRSPVPNRYVDTITARIDFEIGEGRKNAYSFGEISGLTTDREGRIYVSDFKDATIVLFGTAGEFLRRIGRNGDGPGEFRAPTGPAIAADGSLYVRDMTRVTRFVLDPASRLPVRFDRAFRGPTLANWRSKSPTRIDAGSNVYYSDQVLQLGKPRRIRWIKYNALREPIDTIYVPSYSNLASGGAWIVTSQHGGRRVEGLDVVPFAPLPVWDVSYQGLVVAGSGTSYIIEEFDKSRAVRSWSGPAKSTLIDARERNDSIAAFRARVDSLPVAIDQLQQASDDVKMQRVPSSYPFYLAVAALSDGSIWVRRWPRPHHQETIFDRFDSSGAQLDCVILPLAVALEPAPVISSNNVVAVVPDDSGLSTIVRFRWRR